MILLPLKILGVWKLAYHSSCMRGTYYPLDKALGLRMAKVPSDGWIILVEELR